MSTIQIFPIGELLVRCERAVGIVPSLNRDCPVSNFVGEAAASAAPLSGSDWGGAPHVWLNLAFCFGADSRFGDEPDGRRRTNRLVREAVLAAGGRLLQPAAPLHFLAHLFAFGEPWAPNQIFAKLDGLRPSGYEPIRRAVFLGNPVCYGPGLTYRTNFAAFREEEGIGFRVGMVSADDGYSFGPETAYVFGLPVTRSSVP